MKDKTHLTPASADPGSQSAGLSALARLSEDERSEYWAALALRCAKGIGPRTVRRLLGHFGSAYAALQSVPRWAEAKVSPGKGAVLSGPEWRRQARPEWESARDLDGHIVLWTSPLYPEHLKELPDAPALFYARGDLTLLRGACVAVVGSRACTERCIRLTRKIAGELAASGVTVVSGMARGIDGAAHSAAIGEAGGTIAVLGAGLDVVYPPEHLDLYRRTGQTGLLVSEFPPGTLPDGRHFPVRNRIISGLSLGVLVVEGAVRSGSLVTARLAVEHNRAVYAVPPPSFRGEPDEEGAAGSPDQLFPPCPLSEDETDGCVLLLEQGAKPCLAASDILEDLYPLLRDLALSAAPRSRPEPVAPLRVYPSLARDVPPPCLDRALPGTEADPLPALSPKSAKTKHSGGMRASRGKTVPAPAYPPGSPEAIILEALRERGPLFPDDIAAAWGGDMPSGQISATLLMLEVKGEVRRLPGMRYEACV